MSTCNHRIVKTSSIALMVRYFYSIIGDVRDTNFKLYATATVPTTHGHCIGSRRNADLRTPLFPYHTRIYIHYNIICCKLQCFRCSYCSVPVAVIAAAATSGWLDRRFYSSWPGRAYKPSRAVPIPSLDRFRIFILIYIYILNWKYNITAHSNALSVIMYNNIHYIISDYKATNWSLLNFPYNNNR